MPLWLTIIIGLCKAFGLFDKAEGFLSGWEAKREAQGVLKKAGDAAPKDVQGVEDKLDAGQA